MKRSKIKEFIFVKYDNEVFFICDIVKECPNCSKINLIVKREYGGKYFPETNCFFLHKLSPVEKRPRLEKKFLEELLKE